MTETSLWSPCPLAVSVVLRPDPGGTGATTISVRHPTAPYSKPMSGVGNLSDTDIHDLVRDYLESLAGKFQELDFMLASPGQASSADVLNLTCLPIEAEDRKSRWKTSFLFERIIQGEEANNPEETERTLVALAASASLCEGGTEKYGIRVVAHLSEARGTAAITSMSAYLPKGAVVGLIFAGGRHGRGHGRVQGAARIDNNIDVKISSSEPASKGPPETIKFRSPSGKEETLEKYFDRSRYYIAYGAHESSVRFLRYEHSNFVRSDVDISAYNDAAAQVRTGLEVSRKAPPENAEHLRSDHFSAEKAYFNSMLLFERFIHYNIDPESYFRSAEPTLAIHYRSGMPYGPGKDGQTVNAAVQPYEPGRDDPSDDGTVSSPNKWRRHQIAPHLCQSPPELHMHFALANRMHRWRKRWTGEKRSPAQPLGIVADPRWVWHEFGHVLLMATTGELELRFAHSPGDALAAIVSDPGSHLVEGSVDDMKEGRRGWRGATFPWVHIPRRHDRSVKKGWSWSGAMHRPLRKLPDARQPRRKAYRSEQILSTSLFRLYLCLGGMTPNPDFSRLRHAASIYTVYLIMKGLGLLGDARIVAANHPDQLVSALIDADIGTQVFRIDEFLLIGPFAGGFAHKVIRWAFEAQGLYADGAVDNNDKGEPPAVDIYIEDGRLGYEEWCDGRVDHGKGSYVPVSLEGPRSTDSSDQPPDWFSNAIKVNEKEIKVRVGNRGSEVAEDVSVRVFFAEWDGGVLPPWEAGGGGRWTEAGPKGGLAKAKINKRSDIGLFTWEPVPGTTYLILAEASCAADRANTDPDSGLPCSLGPMPLADLVANDNNLGLTLWRWPEKPSSSKDKPEDPAIQRQRA